MAGLFQSHRRLTHDLGVMYVSPTIHSEPENIFEALSAFGASVVLVCFRVTRDCYSLRSDPTRSEVHVLKGSLPFVLAIPLFGHCQGYADSPFYRPVSIVPTAAHVEGWSHGTTKANGVLIDLSELVPSSLPEFDQIRGWSVHSWVDRNRPAHTFHYFLQYDQLNVVFGYDLRVEPVEGTDRIRCTFSALTDPEIDWHRNKDIPVVPLPDDLTPVVIKSGDVLSITTLPLGQGKIPVVHYLRLTRTDLAAASIQ